MPGLVGTEAVFAFVGGDEGKDMVCVMRLQGHLREA